ncbi:MAG: flavodoxin family protein [Actinobacteria bacterium]|nr:MAG: flavodoxin family protein [Actinomycetota bacterium]
MKKIRVAAFLGSPRKQGNTELLLNKAVEGVKSQGYNVKVYNLCELKIMPCQDCSGCEETGTCKYHDDMDQIYSTIRQYNHFILASPVFFAGLSAQTKMMIDRCQAFWCQKYLLGKPLSQKPVERRGLFIVVGGMKQEDEYQAVGLCAKAFFRSISVNSHQSLSLSGVDEKGAILKHPQMLDQAYLCGQKLVQ